MARDANYNKIIHSKRWIALRRIYLAEHPLCEQCRKKELLRPAIDVHHVIPIETGNTYADKAKLAFDINNLMALCRECHVEEHRMMKSGSAEERQRRKDEHKDWFKRTFIDDCPQG